MFELTGSLDRHPDRSCVLLVGHLAGARLFGGERSLVDLLDGFARIGIDVVVAVPPTIVDNAPYLGMLRERSSAVVAVEIPHRDVAAAPDPAVIETFVELIERFGIDAVHVNTVVPREPLFAARRCRVPGIVHARELPHGDPDLCRWLGGSADAIVEQVRCEADHIVANSRATARAFVLSGRTHVVPNMVDIAEFERREPTNPGGPVRVALIGSVTEKKGVFLFHRLAEAMSGRTDAEFVIVGAPSLDIDEWLQANPLGNLRCAGYAERPRDAMDLADVVVSMSIVPESFSRTLIEAMAAGLPVVSFAHGGPLEYIDDGVNGFLVPLGDIDSYTTCLARLVDDPDLRHRTGLAGRSTAVERFSPDVFAAALEETYRNVLPDGAVQHAVAADVRVELSAENNSRFLEPFFVGNRARFATCTDVRFLPDGRCVTASLVGQRMYLVGRRPDGEAPDAWEVLGSEVSTSTGRPCSVDLLDVVGDDEVVTADCDAGTISWYRVTDDGFEHCGSVRLDPGGYFHGVAGVPGHVGVVAVAVTTDAIGVHFVRRSDGRTIDRYSEPGWIPKAVAFESDRRLAVLWTRANVGEVPLFAHDAKASILERSRFTRRWRTAATLPLPGISLDGCRVLGDRLFAANQFEDCVMEFAIGRRSLDIVDRHEGFPMPHGVDVTEEHMAVACYGNSALVFRSRSGHDPVAQRST
jgi:glycosyltransferase involved in cell wall biosynthesis